MQDVMDTQLKILLRWVDNKENENDIWNSKRIEFEDTIIADEDKVLIDKVIDKFADYSATDLVSLTHRQSPWIDAYVPYQYNEITINAIKEYFNS